jgi:hypothetical protein
MTNLPRILIRFCCQEVEDLADETVARRAARAVGPPQTARLWFPPDPGYRGTVLRAAPVRRLRDALRHFERVIKTGQLARSA